VSRRWFLLSTVLAVTLTAGMGGILWYTVQVSSVSEVHAWLDAAKPLLTEIRWFLMATVAITWPLLVNRLRHWRKLDERRAAALLALHWRIVTWLVVIELVLGQSLLGQVLAVLQGSRG
jgi:hypothetical protein